MCWVRKSARSASFSISSGSMASKIQLIQAEAASARPSCFSAQTRSVSLVGNGGPFLRIASSNSCVQSWCWPRSDLWVNGCLSSDSNASAVSFCPIKPATWRKKRPDGVGCSGIPALSSGTMPQRCKAAVTWRVKVRSGVIRAADCSSSAAWRRRSAIAKASDRGELASTKVRSRQASVTSPSFGPSRNH